MTCARARAALACVAEPVASLCAATCLQCTDDVHQEGAFRILSLQEYLSIAASESARWLSSTMLTGKQNSQVLGERVGSSRPEYGWRMGSSPERIELQGVLVQSTASHIRSWLTTFFHPLSVEPKLRRAKRTSSSCNSMTSYSWRRSAKLSTTVFLTDKKLATRVAHKMCAAPITKVPTTDGCKGSASPNTYLFAFANVVPMATFSRSAASLLLFCFCQ